MTTTTTTTMHRPFPSPPPTSVRRTLLLLAECDSALQQLPHLPTTAALRKLVAVTAALVDDRLHGEALRILQALTVLTSNAMPPGVTIADATGRLLLAASDRIERAADDLKARIVFGEATR